MRAITKTLIQRAKPGRYSDSSRCGLSLYVSPLGRQSAQLHWRGTLNRKPIVISMGAAAMWDIDEARAECWTYKRLARQGKDPRPTVESVPSFARMLDAYLELRKLSDGKAAEWRSSLNRYAPGVMRKRIDAIDTADCIRALAPIWTEKPSLAKNVNARISAVAKYAVGKGYIDSNPAGDAVRDSMPKQNIVHVHHAAITYNDLPAALRKVRDATGAASTRDLLTFIALTAVRSTEARLMRWSEIDGSTWTVPAERMKARKAHRVPLSRAARQVLARRSGSGDDLVFGSVGVKSLPKLCQRLQLGTTPHGLRSTFRDWCAECSDAPREVAELCLAHDIGSEVERAYRRSDLLARREALMESWGAFCEASNVVGIRAA